MIGYGVKRQLCDIKEIAAISIVLGILTYYVGVILPLQQNIVMVIQILLYISSYMMITNIFKLESADVYKNLVSNILYKKLKKWN